MYIFVQGLQVRILCIYVEERLEVRILCIYAEERLEVRIFMYVENLKKDVR